MKRLTLLLLISLATNAFSQTQDSTFNITGHIAKLQKGTLYFHYPSNGKFLVDSSAVINGSFKFSGKLSQPVIGYLNLVNTLVIDPRSLYVFLEPTRINVELNNEPFSVIKVEGSKTHNELMLWKNADKALSAKFAPALNKLEVENDKNKHKVLEDSLLLYQEQKFQLEYSFIKDHPRSYVTPYLLDSHYRSYSIAQLNDIYNNMGSKLQTSVFGKRLSADIHNMAFNSTGAIAADIVSNDYINNETFNLRSLKGQYVLIDFWGSWCKPCIKLLPNLVADHDKYKGKNIVFVSVSHDYNANLQKCKDIVNKLGMNWVNLWDSQDTKDVNSITSVYGVGVYPTTILINPNGEILERGEGEYGYLKCKAQLAKIFDL